MCRVYGYCRISTPRQHIKRQIDNIKSKYPAAIIVTEEYTGTKLDRPAWNKLYKDIVKRAKSGDDITVVFDEVSRMSRSADEGYALYKELYELNVRLVFLKEPHINTDVYRETLKQNVSMTGTDVDIILKAVNDYLMVLAEKQIQLAFKTAQQEVDYLHERTSEGVQKAKLAGKRVGIEKGRKLTTKKSKPIKELIRKYSKDFDGALPDDEVLSILKGKTISVTDSKNRTQSKSAGISRNTYYKYKAEMKAAIDSTME